MLERRKFLTALSATMLTAAIPSGTLAATISQTRQCCSLRKQFAQLVGSDFRLLNSAGVAQKARLVAVENGPDCPGLEQFSIVFEGSGLTDGLYKVYHPGTGTLQIGLMSSGEPGSEVDRQRAHFSNFV
jgi:hypothetical protein